MNICTSRPEGRPSHEKNDCTVTALHYTTGLPYAACRAIAFAAGREARKGFNLDRLFAECRTRGLTFDEVGIPRHALNVAGLSHFYPKGIYYVWVESTGRMTHAIALKDGVVYDPAFVGNTRVISLWKYTGTRHSSVETMFD